MALRPIQGLLGTWGQPPGWGPEDEAGTDPLLLGLLDSLPGWGLWGTSPYLLDPVWDRPWGNGDRASPWGRVA